MKENSFINIRAFGLYFFCVFIAFLAGIYFSPFMFVLFIILLIYPVVSLLFLYLSYSNLRFHQEFSKERPVKGEEVLYTVSAANEFILPFPFVNFSFHSVTPNDNITLPDFAVFVNRGENLKKEFTISCPYRGIYTVGLKSLVVEDLMHFVRLKLKVWHKTFYVYPRILNLTKFLMGIENVEGVDKVSQEEGEPDYSMFDRLKEYREGESVKHIYWKKFFILGYPLLKEYDSSPEYGVKIFFDLRKNNQPVAEILETEDTSVEILVAMAKYFMDREIITLIKAPGRDLFEFKGRNPAAFIDFYNQTSGLIFQDTVSPVDVYRADEQQNVFNATSVFFITSILDIDLFNLVQSSLNTSLKLYIVFNQTSYTPEEQQRNNNYFFSLKNQGARIIVVNNSSTIIQDMEAGFK